NSTSPCSLFISNAPATTDISTLSLHDALPISRDPTGEGPRVAALERDDHRGEVRVGRDRFVIVRADPPGMGRGDSGHARDQQRRSEEHTSELQSLTNLVCRLLLEKKKTTNVTT